MNIGKAARLTGLSTRAIRHYESSGIISPATRTDGGYRTFGDRDILTLQFIRNARRLGFELDVVKRLVELWQEGPQARGEVVAIVQSRLDEIKRGEAFLRSNREAIEASFGDSVDDDAACRFVAMLLREVQAER